MLIMMLMTKTTLFLTNFKSFSRNTRHDAALIVLDHLHHESDGNINSLSFKDLEVLLRWKDIPVLKMGNMASRRILYQIYAGDRGDDDLGNPPCWMEADKAALEAWRNVPLEMGDTAYGRFEAQKK